MTCARSIAKRHGSRCTARATRSICRKWLAASQPDAIETGWPLANPMRSRRVDRLTLSVEIEIPPDLLKSLGIDDPRVCFRGLLLRIQHKRHRAASRSECCRIERVQTFVDRVRLGDAQFEFERVNRRHFRATAKGLHTLEA